MPGSPPRPIPWPCPELMAFISPWHLSWSRSHPRDVPSPSLCLPLAQQRHGELSAAPGECGVGPTAPHLFPPPPLSVCPRAFAPLSFSPRLLPFPLFPSPPSYSGLRGPSSIQVPGALTLTLSGSRSLSVPVPCSSSQAPRLLCHPFLLSPLHPLLQAGLRSISPSRSLYSQGLWSGVNR